MLVGCLVVTAFACLVLGAAISLVTVIVLVPLLGLSRGLVDVLTRVLLQRSAPPSELASVFGAAETLAGIGGLAGSLTAQVLIASSGASAALITIGLVFVGAGASLALPLRAADDDADVPVVAMSLLRRLPVFAPLPVWSLEAVARGARELAVDDGTAVITQGETGDAFYAIDDLCSHGEFLLSEGYVEPDCTVECIGHGALFSLRDGRALSLPATEDVRAHPTRVVDGVVEVEVDQTRVR